MGFVIVVVILDGVLLDVFRLMLFEVVDYVVVVIFFGMFLVVFMYLIGVLLIVIGLLYVEKII